MLNGQEILIIAIVIMVLFGATAIPKFARNLGKAKKEFEQGMKDGSAKKDEESDESGKSESSSEQKPREL